MGIPIPLPPTPPGAPDCPACTPYPWAPGTTPYEIRSVFHHLTTYPGFPDFPNHIPIHIRQSILNPCDWTADFYYLGALWRIGYWAEISRLMAVIQYPMVWTYFYALGHECDGGPFYNAAYWPDNSPIGGHGHVLDLPLASVSLLAFEYNLLPDPRALYDVVDSLTPPHQTVRLTGRTYPGSVLIEFDPGAV